MPMSPEARIPAHRKKPSASEQSRLRRDLARTRKRLGYSFKKIEEESGFYTDSMICKVECGTAKMSRRGFESLRRWIDSHREQQ